MSIEIRPVQADELPGYVESLTTSFLERPDVPRLARELSDLWDLERSWGAFEHGRVIGTFRSFTSELTLPGCGRLRAAAVTGVTVLPTHRRRGILRALVAAEHRAARERGEAVGLLYASEYPIYGRFGYGPGVREARWTVDASATTVHGPSAERVEFVAPSETVRDEMKAVFDAWRRRQTGEVARLDYRWDFDLGLRPSMWGPDWKGFLVLHRDAAGTVDGYARYRAEEKWEQRQPRNILKVDELHALNDGAYRDLWRFLVDVDLVATVQAERRSPTEKLPWLLTNQRAAVPDDVGDGLWLRLLDVPRALAARTYERAGRLVLDVVDPEARGGRLRVDLDAGPDGATCSVSDRSADLTLDVAALGAAYLGGTPLRYAVLAGGVDEHRPGALRAADALFRTLDEPWTSTFF